MTVTLKMEDCELAAVLAVQKHLAAIGANDNLQETIEQLTLLMLACTGGVWTMAGKQAALASIDVVRSRVMEYEEVPPGDLNRHDMPGAMQ